MSHSTHPALRAAAVAAFLGAIALGTPASAAPLDLIHSSAASTQQASSTVVTHAKATSVDAVELRIKELHAKLKINPSQEELWNRVTQVMRANASAMDQLVNARAENWKNMTAIDDLSSYARVADAHADGIKRFIPVFQALYDTMSPAQRQNADAIFRNRMHAAQKRAAAKTN